MMNSIRIQVRVLDCVLFYRHVSGKKARLKVECIIQYVIAFTDKMSILLLLGNHMCQLSLKQYCADMVCNKR